jgi:hypothetical protein
MRTDAKEEGRENEKEMHTYFAQKHQVAVFAYIFKT